MTDGVPPFDLGAPMRRIGILGGTFDPIHYAHLAIADDVREALGLAGVLFVPAGRPPHKPDRPISPAEDRLAMVRLAIADNPAFGASRIELDRPGLSYAVDTVENLVEGERAAGRPGDFTFILSAEAFVQLTTWRDPARLLRVCRLAVVPRGGHDVDARGFLAETYPDAVERVDFLAGPWLGHSASDIRARVRDGRTIRYLVPPAVAAFIAERGLYRDGGPIDRDR